MQGLSDKQRKILAFPFTNYDALICDGAIRSGKTSIMMISFIDDAMRRFNGQRFGICGKTVDSTTKNIIMPYLALSYANQKYKLTWRKTDKLLIVSRGKQVNYFEVFGGKDESSFALIQGRTFAGVILDEVALQPRSFVEQALARCSVAGSKLWFNCNPASPAHWFYQEWILKANEKNALHLHFRLEDNPSLTANIIKRYESMYQGLFYQRYILGEWVLAEGLIFPYKSEINGITNETTKALLNGGYYYISCDYGITNPFVAQLWYVKYHEAICVDEYYYSSRANDDKRKTDEEHYACIEELINGRPIEFIIIDPSATSMIELIRRKEKYAVRGANNDVIGGIGEMTTFLANGWLKYNVDRCKNTLTEFGLYSWDKESGIDRPIKENDHGMDASRYICKTLLSREW